MPQSPVSIVFRFNAPVADSPINERMMQPVLVSPIPPGSQGFEGVMVLRGQPVFQDGAGANTVPFTGGVLGTVQVDRGPGIEPVVDFFDGPDWFRYLEALDREGDLDEVFKTVAAGNPMIEALAAHAVGALRLEGPAKSECWVFAPGERYGMGDTVLVSDIHDPEGYYEDGRVEPGVFWVLRHTHGAPSTSAYSTSMSWTGTEKLDIPNWPDDEDRADFKDYLRAMGKAVLLEGQPLAETVRKLEHSLQNAFPNAMMPGP